MFDYSTKTHQHEEQSAHAINSKQKLYELVVKTFPKCSSVGMVKGSTKNLRNKTMAYTYHNDAMTSALQMLVSRLLVLVWIIPIYTYTFWKCFYIYSYALDPAANLCYCLSHLKGSKNQPLCWTSRGIIQFSR